MIIGKLEVNTYKFFANYIYPMRKSQRPMNEVKPKESEEMRIQIALESP